MEKDFLQKSRDYLKTLKPTPGKQIDNSAAPGLVDGISRAVLNGKTSEEVFKAEQKKLEKYEIFLRGADL